MAVATLNDKVTFSLSVTDRHSSAAWFEKMLGFPVLFHADDAGWSELATLTEGVSLGLAGCETVTPCEAMIVFGTPDLDAARSALEAEGVRFEGDTMEVEGMVKLATFFDPDGNALMLAQDLMS